MSLYPSLKSAVVGLANFAYQKGMEHEPISDADIDGWTKELSSYPNDESAVKDAAIQGLTELNKVNESEIQRLEDGEKH